MRLPRLYTEWAGWWPLVSSPDDYREEAEVYANALEAACDGPVRRVLELGSGGGNNASHLKRRFEMTLVDASPAMLAVSRALNPECRHLEGDMRTFRLDERFDAVFIHDAVVYLVTEAELRRLLATAAAHCRAGGAVLVAPDHTAETFVTTTGHGGRDDGERGARYLQWSWDPDPDDTTYLTQFVLVRREGAAPPRVEHERHTCGLFPRRTWLRLLREAGFRARRQVLELTDVEPGRCEYFVGCRRRR
ncbi:MAG: class I SAM-dependent methyltransferase [Lentisphaerae bacterium]|nr:class I SAM-dependent methyltransferase [Lentisphaerota bacterium]